MHIEAKGICHQYGKLNVLDGINLTFSANQITAIIGPSGCGKSTLLSILGGLSEPSAGEVLIHGEAPADSLNPFTYVFQDFALLPWLTVRGNVEIVLRHHMLPEAEKHERVLGALGRLGLAEFRDYLPKQLSGGMRQRVGIARSLVVSPSIMLMDEPLSALDAQTRELLMDDFVALWAREKLTGIYVTHNLEEALRLADRVAVLSRRPGRVKEIVEIAIPRAERSQPGVQAELVMHKAMLWKLIRDEAMAAEQELIDE